MPPKVLVTTAAALPFFQVATFIDVAPSFHALPVRQSFLMHLLFSALFAFSCASIAITTAALLHHQDLTLRNSSIEAVRSPYAPTVGWTYAIEAIRGSPWPACPYRFLSFPDSCDSVDLWRGAGVNQFWTIEAASSADPTVFHLRGSCGSYLRCPCPAR